jgi:hypothetical protein
MAICVISTFPLNGLNHRRRGATIFLRQINLPASKKPNPAKSIRFTRIDEARFRSYHLLKVRQQTMPVTLILELPEELARRISAL